MVERQTKLKEWEGDEDSDSIDLLDDDEEDEEFED